MNDFDQTHRGATFRRFDFREAVFDDTYLTGVRIRNADLRGVVIRGSLVLDVTIDGEVGNLVVNGVDAEGVPRDRSARPDLDTVLALRRDRMDTMRETIEGATDEQLAGTTDPVAEPGYPESQAFPVGEVLATVVNEEWHHHVYANRDLAVLESRAGLTPQN